MVYNSLYNLVYIRKLYISYQIGETVSHQLSSNSVELVGQCPTNWKANRYSLKKKVSNRIGKKAVLRIRDNLLSQYHQSSKTSFSKPVFCGLFLYFANS